jgi:hypothetical protein
MVFEPFLSSFENVISVIKAAVAHRHSFISILYPQYYPESAAKGILKAPWIPHSPICRTSRESVRVAWHCRWATWQTQWALCQWDTSRSHPPWAWGACATNKRLISRGAAAASPQRRHWPTLLVSASQLQTAKYHFFQIGAKTKRTSLQIRVKTNWRTRSNNSHAPFA